MLLPQANILLIIRNQIESILSWYISHGSRLRNVPQDYWQRYVAPEQAVDFLLNFPQFTIERSFNYLGIYKIYSDLFGKDRVFCVPYELLNANNNLFFSTLSKALDVSPSHLMNIYARTRVRERRSYWHLKLHSIFVNYNSLLRCTKIINLLDRLYPSDFNHIFSEQTKRQIWDKYKVQNAELSDMIGYDLKSLGYPQ